MNGTPAGTPAETPAGTPDDNEYLPPCRQAGFFIAPCPRCGRELTLKTLRYTHVCGRSFDPEQRAHELQAAAEKAINARMASWEQSAERRMQQPAEHTQPNLDKNKVCQFIKMLNDRLEARIWKKCGSLFLNSAHLGCGQALIKYGLSPNLIRAKRDFPYL